MKCLGFSDNNRLGLQCRSKNAEKVTHIKWRPLETKQWFSSIASRLKMGTSLKGENSLLERERIISFKSSSIWYEKSLLPHWVTSLECYYISFARA